MQAQQEIEWLQAEVESMLRKQLGVANEETMETLGVVTQDLM